MSDRSPLFVSSMELLAHSADLYSKGNDRKYKFIILHLANAIELILKDSLIDNGISIYAPRKSQTIGIWEACDALENIGIRMPERPIIELLVDDRNTIQHRFGFPNAEAVYYYLGHVVSFFKRFLSDQYDIKLEDALKSYISTDELALLGLLENQNSASATLDKLFSLSPEAAVQRAYSLIIGSLVRIAAADPATEGQTVGRLSMPTIHQILHDLAEHEYISRSTLEQWEFLQETRNRAAHLDQAPEGDSSPKWAEAMVVAKDLLSSIARATQDGYLYTN